MILKERMKSINSIISIFYVIGLNRLNMNMGELNQELMPIKQKYVEYKEKVRVETLKVKIISV